ncbi:Hypothetical predicted protein [Paramuricea clavata]|uniref:Uncharacterized protein n=1 Tax=Paramuricea clavata TaxID=317549 RepID=A0A6S7G2E2_PARCT|nr:Hypothetical predicted protein [Paramuricea clavata]
MIIVVLIFACILRIGKNTRTKGKEKQRAAKSKPKTMSEEIDVNMDSEQPKSYLCMTILMCSLCFNSSTPLKSKPLEKTIELHSEEDDILNINSLSQSSDNLNQSYRMLDDTASVHRSSPTGSSSSDVGSDSDQDSLSECALSDEDSDRNSDKDSDENIT